MQLRPSRSTTLAVVTLVIAACDSTGSKVDDAAPMSDAATDATIDAAADARIDAPGFCDNETRDDEYTPGMIKTGANGYDVLLLSSTPPPGAKGNEAWSIQVRDPSDAPRDGLTIQVIPYMPDHGHGTAVQAVVTPSANGTYGLDPLNLFMTGLWTITLRLVDGAQLDEVVFTFCVD